MPVALPVDVVKASLLRGNGGLAQVPVIPHEEITNLYEPLRLFWPELERALPDKGFPRGVVELATPRSLGGATRVALAAVRGGQGRGEGAWCAWVDSEASLYAPGVAKARIDLRRLLVVRPTRRDIGRVAVKLVQSRAFEVIVVDYAQPSFMQSRPRGQGHSDAGSSQWNRGGSLRPEVLVRKLALLAEEGGSTVIFLTDSCKPRPIPWPVALKLELSRSSESLKVKVVKDRFCRLGTVKIGWRSRSERTALAAVAG